MLRYLLSFSILSSLVGLLCASDPSTYRGLRLGMTLPAVAKQVGLPASEARLIHKRPATIQELEWHPNYTFRVSPKPDPVGTVLFSFCNDALFRMVITYDRDRTQGMTVDDIVEVLSKDYGVPAKPVDAEMMFPSLFNEKVSVLARWEDADYSVNLLRSSYQPSFGLVFVSKKAELAAQKAIDEAARLDIEEAPQREAEIVDRMNQENRAKDRESRQTNKPNFRP